LVGITNFWFKNIKILITITVLFAMSTFELQENYSSDSSNDADYVPNGRIFFKKKGLIFFLIFCFLFNLFYFLKADEIDSEDESELVEVAQDEEDPESKLITRSKRKEIEADIETHNNIKKQK
jgi:hypothetical protein